MNRLTAVVALAILALPVAGHAQEQTQHPLQLSLITPVQLFPETDPIHGVRLNIFYGRSEEMVGLDLGLVNHTTEEFRGVQFGLAGLAEGHFKGVQVNNVNLVKGLMEGFQWGFLNGVDEGRGLQLGAVNYATMSHRGLEIGLVNYANSMNGVQIGFINIIRHGAPFPVLPIINWAGLDEGD